MLHTIFYADDTQIYIRIDSTKDVKEKLSSLINDIKIWMNGRKLKLNDGKTDIIIVKGNLRSNVVEEFGDLELPCTHLCPSVSARNLGPESLTFVLENVLTHILEL